MLAVLSLMLAASQSSAVGDETWIGNFKTGADEFSPHIFGTTQELTLHLDGSCRLVTRNHHLMGSDLVEVIREGTYVRNGKSLAAIELVKDGAKIKVNVEDRDNQLIVEGGATPFNFSKPTFFSPVARESERTTDGRYQLTLSNKTNQQSTTFPQVVFIEKGAYAISSTSNPRSIVEKGLVSSRRLANGKAAITFSSDSPRALLNGKTWIDLYFGEIWTVPNSFAIEFPDMARTAGDLDFILLQRVKALNPAKAGS